jgi:hypothetical protein
MNFEKILKAIVATKSSVFLYKHESGNALISINRKNGGRRCERRRCIRCAQAEVRAR